MSMLAEPKKKFRVGLNPRGTLWTNDENKFGQKLLEKMGWSKGKGLGKEEQGCQEPIRVSANSENRGVGFTGNSEDYSHHYERFEDVLANLNSEHNTDNSLEQNISASENILENVQSLEEKSKNSKSRVHYKKFTKSKDLSRYNEDDLACVLGSKRVKRDKGEGTPQAQKASTPEETGTQIGEMDQSHGMTTIFGGNLKDYFTHKMSELKRKREEGLLGDGAVHTPSQAKRLRLDSVPGTPLRDLEFEPERTEFSFNISTQEPEPEEEIECQIASPELKTKKKKKKKLKENDLENEEMLEDNKKLKKKKKKDKKEKCEESDKENQILQEEVSNKRKKENEDMNGIVEGESNGNVEEIKKKKKNKHNVEDECFIQEHQDIEENSNITIKEKKKKKKDKKTKEEEKESNFKNNDTLTSEDQSEVALKEKKKKKKDKKIKHEEEMYNCENADGEIGQQPLSTECDESEVSLEKKKKRKKDRKTDLEEEIAAKTFNCENNDSQASEYIQPLGTEMNESYVKATSKEDQKKKKKAKNEDERDESESHKSLKKLRKLASEISLTDILKSASEKSGTQRNNVLVADDNEPVDEEERKPKVKLTSKRSFKEFKNDLEEKIRKRVKKRDKKDMETIEEEEKTVEKLAVDQDEIETTTSTIVSVTVPIREKDARYNSKIKSHKLINVDVEKLFPGSNLLSIAGYRKSNI